MPFYERNLQALLSQNSFLAARLVAFQGNERFEVFQDPSDTLNVNIVDKKTQAIFYDGIPKDEIVRQVDRFENEFSRYPVLFVYGVANGLFLKLLLQNENHTHTIVIEPELEVLYIAFHLLDFSAEINAGRLYFFLDNEIDFMKAVAIFSDSAIKVFSKTYHLEPNILYYEQVYGDALLECNAKIVRGIQHVVTGLGNDTSDALIGLEWHLANIYKMIETPTLLELIQKAKTTKTAIIISTGPSLSKQLPLLKSIKEHATLLSVDASLPILEKHGIKPDMVFSIERVAETAEFYHRTSREFQEGIICAMSSLSHPALVESINGATLQMSMRPFGYTRYFNLPEYGYIGIGMSAANMAYELAFHAGFDTIILIGQDLAYAPDGGSHSQGHVFGSLKQRKDDVIVQGYGGKENVRTSVIWNMFRNFFENDIQIANDSGTVTVNATEGGARIHGAIELPFAEAIRQYIDQERVKERIVLSKPDSAEVEAKKRFVAEKISFMENYVETTQKRVADLFEKVAECVERLDKMKAKDNLAAVDYDELAVLMGEIDEIKVKFDDPEFVDIFIDAAQALIVHHELEIARIQVRAINNDDDRRMKMIDWIYAHKAWLFALAGIMEAEMIGIKRRGEQSQYVHKAKFGESSEVIIGSFYDYRYEVNEFEIELLIDGESVVNKRLSVAKDQKGFFTVSIPARFYDNQVHGIVVREKHTGIILAGMPEQRILLNDDQPKAAFMESLDDIDTVKVKELYCKDAIGFLAVDENLENEDFVRYIRELSAHFPNAKLKAFYFEKDKISRLQELFEGITVETILLRNFEQFVENVEIYIDGFEMKSSIRVLNNALTQNSPHIHIITYKIPSMPEKVRELDYQSGVQQHLILNNLPLFGYTPEFAKNNNDNIIRMHYNAILEKLDKPLLQDDDLISTVAYFESIKYALKYPEFKAHFNHIRNAVFSLVR